MHKYERILIRACQVLLLLAATALAIVCCSGCTLRNGWPRPLPVDWQERHNH